MSLFIVFYLWVRASFPRMRVDQLMSYAWKVLIPFALLQIFLNGLVIVYDLPARDVWLFADLRRRRAVALVYFAYGAVRAASRASRCTMVAGSMPARSVV